MNAPLPIRLYNTFTRTLESFEPITPGKIGLYCCGPTVYDFQHIGNFKTFIFEDVLARMLRFAGYDVRHVMNITDVGHLTGDNDEGEDKMLLAMRREGKTSYDIAQFYTDKFFEDWDKLHLRRPDVVCKATEHIQEMIDLIGRIEANGFAYESGGNIYFDVAKFENYGKLALLDLKKLKAGARIDVDSNKRNPYDFVLWFTKSKFEDQELQWDSPWGRGYPGWHIECSAMSMKYLGDQFDIHCGGIDHIPIHHTNEIAQSEAATGARWVNVWMHSEFILLNQEKMSKSKGGFLTLDNVLEQGLSPAAYRFLVLGAHYRQQLNFSWNAMKQAERNVERLTNIVLSLRTEAGAEPASLRPGNAGELTDSAANYLSEFADAVCNDLNTPQALAVLWRAASDTTLSATERLQVLYSFDEVLGLGARNWKAIEVELPEEVATLVAAREAARASKDWAEADRLRDEILSLGFVVKDADGKSVVTPSKPT